VASIGPFRTPSRRGAIVASTLLHGVLGMFPATRMKHGVRVWLRPSQKEATRLPHWKPGAPAI
jgi:hypothetical protein